MKSTDSQKTQPSQDDIATLYSWANLAGAKYKDFSASRREVRMQARQRMAEIVPEDAADEVPRRALVVDEPLNVPAASVKAVLEPAESYPESSASGQPLHFLETALQEAMIPAAVAPPPTPVSAAHVVEPFPAIPVTIPRAAPVHAAAGGIPAPGRTTARWAALKGIFDPARDHKRSPAAAPKVAVPVVAVFSLAGGVGKSSIVATLGRILAARGERVLLVDATPYGTLPFYYGASEWQPGTVRTFTGEGIEAPIQVLSLDPDELASKPDAGWLTYLLQRNAASVDRILIDMGTASKLLARAVLSLAPTVIVPVVPDMSSMVSLQAVKGYFDDPETQTTPVVPYYLLNRFDAAAPMHEDIRSLIGEQFGDRLLPIALRSSSEVSEALAEGMTVADYAPDSTVNEEYAAIAEWVRLRGASPARKLRGVRWSEQ